VHCKAGRGRSTTVVLCYLVKYKGMTPGEALAMVRGKRPQIHLAQVCLMPVIMILPDSRQTSTRKFRHPEWVQSLSGSKSFGLSSFMFHSVSPEKVRRIMCWSVVAALGWRNHIVDFPALSMQTPAACLPGVSGTSHEHCCGFPQGQWAAIEEFAATCDAVPATTPQINAPAVAAADRVSGTSASDGTDDAPRQHEAVTGLPAASRPDAVDDRSSAANTMPGSSHEAQAAAVAEHHAKNLQLPALADGSGVGSGPASVASWPAAQVAGDVSASSYAVGITGAARSATPGAASSETTASRDQHSAPQQEFDAVTARPDHGHAEADSLPLRFQRMEVQPSDAMAHTRDARSSGLVPAAADLPESKWQPAAREQQQAVGESSARQQAGSEARDAAAAWQRSEAAAALEEMSGAGDRAAAGGDAGDMGSSWESDVHAGADAHSVCELDKITRATQLHHACSVSSSRTCAAQASIALGFLLRYSAALLLPATGVTGMAQPFSNKPIKSAHRCARSPKPVAGGPSANDRRQPAVCLRVRRVAGVARCSATHAAV